MTIDAPLLLGPLVLPVSAYSRGHVHGAPVCLENGLSSRVMGVVMAKDGLVTSIEVRFAWLVKPYLRLVTLFILSVEPFLDVDDERLDQFLRRQGDFITRYGLKLSADGKSL
ncbi:hypothetical protein [Brucella anthropi]|uniref:hypothetical protein n=1 Tax=Brucella anthropi TaxID=529 RepID=UPI00125E763B|nr:hypothetical protein [Brucella anthropi]QFP61891.1 hypothetical protein FT787_01580 [Brucella anthropi]